MKNKQQTGLNICENITTRERMLTTTVAIMTTKTTVLEPATNNGDAEVGKDIDDNSFWNSLPNSVR